MANPQKKYEQLRRRNAAVLALPAENQLWRDENFWRDQWPGMVDREAEALEATLKIKT